MFYLTKGPSSDMTAEHVSRLDETLQYIELATMRIQSFRL